MSAIPIFNSNNGSITYDTSYLNIWSNTSSSGGGGGGSGGSGATGKN